jgi:phosphoserine aminotransferase
MKCFLPIKKTFVSNVKNFDGYSILPSNNLYSLTNVSPGPATINPLVLKEISDELTNDNICKYGYTSLEMSHRSPEFDTIITNVNKKIKSFMEIPDEFSIIWTQGGGHGQFSAIPLNMNHVFESVVGYYFVTGTWSSRAFKESQKFINSVNMTEGFYKNFKNNLEYNKLPTKIKVPKDASYLYICSNETVNGLEFKSNSIKYPTKKELGDTKLIVDMSSDFLMKKIDWSNIDMAFACTSKNMGAPGANVIIIKKKLLENMKYNLDKPIPCVLDWKLYADSNSLYNTPAVFNFYLLDKILDKYIDEMKNIEQMDNYNQAKGEYIYNFLDNSEDFTPCVKDISSRSNVNIPFIVGDGGDEIRSNFLEHCYNHNLVGLRTKTPFSYDSMGLIEPLRISLYNGIKIEDVKRIIEIMEVFKINT